MKPAGEKKLPRGGHEERPCFGTGAGGKDPETGKPSKAKLKELGFENLADALPSLFFRLYPNVA